MNLLAQVCCLFRALLYLQQKFSDFTVAPECALVLCLQGAKTGDKDGTTWRGGGALCLIKIAGESANLVSLTMTNSIFLNNSAYDFAAHGAHGDGDGGGVRVDAADGVQMHNTTFA